MDFRIQTYSSACCVSHGAAPESFNSTCTTTTAVLENKGVRADLAQKNMKLVRRGNKLRKNDTDCEHKKAP